MVSRTATLNRVAIDPTTSLVESLEAIVRRFPAHFVLVDQCRFDDRGRLTHGRVIDATPDRDAIYAQLRQNPNSVIIFTGPNAQDEDGAFLDGGQVRARCHQRKVH